MSATWGNPENIYSLRVLPPVTPSGLLIRLEGRARGRSGGCFLETDGSTAVSHSVLLPQTFPNESCCPLVTDLLSGLRVVRKSCVSSTLSFGWTGSAPNARSSRICFRNSGPAKTGEICDFDQVFRRAPRDNRSQAGDAGITIVADQPAGFGEFRGGAFVLALRP